jgi:hypothetical protein
MMTEDNLAYHRNLVSGTAGEHVSHAEALQKRIAELEQTLKGKEMASNNKANLQDGRKIVGDGAVRNQYLQDGRKIVGDGAVRNQYLQDLAKVLGKRVSALEDWAAEDLGIAQQVNTNEGHLLELAKTVRDLTIEVIKLRGDHDTTKHMLRTLLQALPDPNTPNSVYTFDEAPDNAFGDASDGTFGTANNVFEDTPLSRGRVDQRGEDFVDSVVEDIDAEDGDPTKASARVFLQTGLDLAILPPEDTLFVHLISPPDVSNPQDCTDFDSYLLKLTTEATSLGIFDSSYVNHIARMVFGAESTDSVTRVAPALTLEATKACIGVWQNEGRSLVVSFTHPRSEHRLILVALIAAMLDVVSSQQVEGHVHSLVKAAQQNT